MSTEKENNTSKIDRLINHIELHSPAPGQDHSAEKSFSRLMMRIQTDHPSIDLFRHRINRYRIGLAAASIALLLSMSGWLYMLLETAPSFIIKSNNSGIVQNVPLPDGTMIKLNNHSKLIYPERFSGDTREIFMEGEAYFDVAHDKQHPFIVRAGELKIRVLGTKFTVNANSQSPQITATLLEGSIEVASGKRLMMMKPNEQLTYNVGNNTMQLTTLDDATREIRWTQNVWTLTETPLLDICQRLEQLFNVKIIIMNDELIEKSFTGEFYTNESLESILKTMQISTSFHYERKGKNIILK